MMKYALYDILIHIGLAALTPYFAVKMTAGRKYRKGLKERFGRIEDAKLGALDGGPVVWFHAVSVGETRAVMPLVREFRSRHPEFRVLFSTVTETGQAIAEREGAGLIDVLIYFPLDLPWVVKGVLRGVHPECFVVVEKEVWPNFIKTLDSSRVPVIVVNGTLSERSYRRYKRFSFFFSDVFGRIGFFSARTEGDRERAVDVGVPSGRARTTGNMKFDLSASGLVERKAAELKEIVGTGQSVVTVGSTHDGEEEIALRAFMGLRDAVKGARLILVPRHPERFDEVEAIVKRTGLAYVRRSRTRGPMPPGAEVLILDTMGELMAAYSFSDVAVVAGSLVPGIGGHNLLEPAYFGVPVIYGSHLSTYLGMAEMLEAGGGGVRVDGANGLGRALKRLLTDGEERRRVGVAAKRVVDENRGAVERTADIIDGFLKDPGRGPR